MKKILMLVVLTLTWTSLNAQVWTAQTSGVTSILRSVAAVDANTCYISGDAGVIKKTVNGGITWTTVPSASGTNGMDIIRALDENTVFALSNTVGANVYMTSNGGTNWTLVLNQPGGYFDDIVFKDRLNGFLLGDCVGNRWTLFKTTNGGVNWDSTGMYLPQTSPETGSFDNCMAIQGNTLWFGTDGTRIYKSTNFGTNWTASATTGMAQSTCITFNGLVGFATGSSAASKSTDGGATWAVVTLTGTGGNIHFASSGNTFWYDRTSGFYVSTDNGANFSLAYAGTTNGGTFWTMRAVKAGSVTSLWASGYAGGIWNYKSLSNVLWAQDEMVNLPGAGPSGSDCSILAPAGVTTLYGPNYTQSAGYRVADDFVVPNNKIFIVDSLWTYGYQTGAVAPTSSITATMLKLWKGLGPDSTGATIVYGDEATNRMTSTVFSNIYRTLRTPIGTTRAIMKQTVNLGHTTLGVGTYWVDFGATGSTSYTGPWAPVRTLTDTNSTGCYTGNGRQRVSTAPSWVALLDVAYQKGVPFILFGSFSDSPTDVSNTNTIAPGTYSLDQNYPNPFNPVTNISFAIPKAGHVTLKIFDVLGKEVAVLVNDVRNPGKYSVNFDGTNFASGIYFYRLESGSFISTQKMTLIK